MSDSDNVSRLIKFMGMTTSSNDGEALTALRMANRNLAELGKSWEELLKGKITIIADPFANVPPPLETRGRTTPPHAWPPRQAPSYAPKVPPRPTVKPTRPQAQSTPRPTAASPQAGPRQNFYGGPCCACTNYVGAKNGFIKRDVTDSHWQIYCAPCFQSNAKPAPKPSKPAAPIGDLS